MANRRIGEVPVEVVNRTGPTPKAGTVRDFPSITHLESTIAQLENDVQSFDRSISGLSRLVESLNTTITRALELRARVSEVASTVEAALPSKSKATPKPRSVVLSDTSETTDQPPSDEGG